MKHGFSLEPVFLSYWRKHVCDVEGCRFDHAAIEVPIWKNRFDFQLLMSCNYQFTPASPRKSHMVSFKITVNHKCCLEGEELSWTRSAKHVYRFNEQTIWEALSKLTPLLWDLKRISAEEIIKFNHRHAFFFLLKPPKSQNYIHLNFIYDNFFCETTAIETICSLFLLHNKASNAYQSSPHRWHANE